MHSNYSNRILNLFFLFLSFSTGLLAPRNQRPVKYKVSTSLLGRNRYVSKMNPDYLRWLRTRQDVSMSFQLPEPNRSNPEISESQASTTSTSTLPTATTTAKDIEGGEECCVCLENLIEEGQDPADTSKLSYCKKQCGTWMHKECMAGWLQEKSICPFCRATWEGGNDDNDVQSGTSPLVSQTIRNLRTRFTPPKVESFELSKSLALVSTMDDFFEWNRVNENAGMVEKPLSDKVMQAIDNLQDERITSMLSLQTDEHVDQLLNVFSKYDAPIGLMPQLLGLSTTQMIEIIVGNVGSYYSTVLLDIQRMVELISFIPFSHVNFVLSIKFLSKQGEVRLTQSRNERPTQFMANVYTQLYNAVYDSPDVSGRPVYQQLEESLITNMGMKVVRYYYSSVQPSQDEISRFQGLVMHRRDAHSNPITFISLTSNLHNVGWMGAMARIPSCAMVQEYSIAKAVADSIQGKSIPYSRGLHLGVQLISVFRSDIYKPLKYGRTLFLSNQLSDIMGYFVDEYDYRYYSDHFSPVSRFRIRS